MVKSTGAAGPGCVNASNPYHRCADFCSKGIDEAMVVKGSKDSANRGGAKENSLRQKMEKERRTNPQCVNASNPYHVCAEYCSERTHQSTAQTIKQKPGETALHKVTAKERKVHPDCVNASNPYHVCAAYCFEKMPKTAIQMDKKESGPIFIDSLNKSSERRKRGSKFQYTPMQVLDGVSVLIKVRSAKAPPPSSLPSSNKMEESDNVEPIPSSQQDSEETPPKDPPFEGVPKLEGIKSISGAKSNKQENDQGENIAASPLMGSISSNISDITTLEDGDKEEAWSMISDSRVQVGKYYVKENNASILQSIFDKRGDIAANCVLESSLIRSCYLDCVCSLVRELQATPFTVLTKSRAKELSSILSDIESSQINVGWLRDRLDEVTEAMELISQHRSIKAAKVKCDQLMEETRKELESQVEDLAQKEKEVADAKARVLGMEQRLSELETESSQLNESYSTIRSKVEKMHVKPMSDAAM